MENARVESVLKAMAAEDRQRADHARSVIEWLTGGEGIAGVDLAGVLRFAWYEMPVKWAGPLDMRTAVLEAAGELFKRLRLERYAYVFLSHETRAILEAYERSDSEGFEAFQAGYARSGVDPPDLDDFAWGDVMGWEEISARRATERALEEAIVAGDLSPGASGWKSAARAITAEVLDGLHPEIPVHSRRDAIVTERLESWIGRPERGSRELHALRSRHVKRLLHPVATPADVEERMVPIFWFLDRAEQGIRLTQAGYLPTAMVREGWERFGWDLGWTDRPPRSESEATEIHEIHHLLRRLRAVRRRGSDLLLTSRGRHLTQHVDAAWRMVATGLSDGEWPRAVAEVVTLLLFDGVRLDRELEARSAAILGEVGWRTGDEPPDSRAVMSGWYETRRPLSVLGGIDRIGDWRVSESVLTAFGEATLTEHLRATATGPRSRPW